MSQYGEQTAAMLALRHLENAARNKHPNEALHTTIARARDTLYAEMQALAHTPSDPIVYPANTTDKEP